MPKSKNITIRFCFTKDAGEYPDLSQFSEEEIFDLRKCLALNLCYSPKIIKHAKIISIQIIHDGITPVENEIEGYVINRDDEYPLVGTPTPVVRFQLDREMEENKFEKVINESFFQVYTEAIQQNEYEPYFKEDHNGYTSVLPEEERDNLIKFLRRYKAYCNKIFHFPEGMPTNGHSIPASDFALKPKHT